MKTLRTAGAILLTFALSAAVAAADEPRLKNDDRLTGTVVRLERGTLTFKTPHGDLQVAWPDVASIQRPTANCSSRRDRESRDRSSSIPQEPVPPLGDITAIETPAPPLQWDGAANAGLLTTGGNTDVTNPRLDGELIARTALDRYTTTAVVNRAEDAGRETARNWTAAFAYDRFSPSACLQTRRPSLRTTVSGISICERPWAAGPAIRSGTRRPRGSRLTAASATSTRTSRPPTTTATRRSARRPESIDRSLSMTFGYRF